MRQRMIPLGKVFGIQVGLDYSWFLIIALLTGSLALNYFPAQFAGWSTALYWVLGGGAALMLFVSVLLHEFGHSLVALAYHIPVRRIRLMFFGGVAEIGDEPTSATAEFRIAIAGPLVSFALAGLFYLAYAALNVTGALVPVTALLGYLALINLTLAIFNLVPGFPLDGGRVLRAAIWGITGDMSRSTRIAVSVGRVIAFVLFGAGLFQILIGSIANGLWTMFIGFFLQQAGTAEWRSQMIHDLLAGRTVAQVMEPNAASIPADLRLQDIVDRYVTGFNIRSFIVVEGDEPVGILSAAAIKSVPRNLWPSTTASGAMIPLDKMDSVDPDTSLWRALLTMESDGQNQLPVIGEGRLLGLLRRDDVLGLARTSQMSHA
jgi:Zn-dependent protease/CBS domain-containing protein